MNLHPRIKELSEVIKEVNPNPVMSKQTLEHLASYGATATEAAITLHLCFSITLEDASEFVHENDVFPPESANDSLYFTMTYMYYDDKQ